MCTPVVQQSLPKKELRLKNPPNRIQQHTLLFSI